LTLGGGLTVQENSGRRTGLRTELERTS
jgi:hypothetical protein